MPWDSQDHWMRDPLARRGLKMIGAAMRRQRERRGLSQRSVEGMTGVHQSTISKLENGKRFGLRWSRFARVVAVLGGLDFMSSALEPVFGRAGLSPNREVARSQLEDAAFALQVMRRRLEDGEAELEVLRRRLDEADRVA
jgi:transcriptional regulator with XRE-family HTH domain